jgi:hypothetical protein
MMAGDSISTHRRLSYGQAGVCWAVVAEDGGFAYKINAGSATVSAYAAVSDGLLTLLNATAAMEGAGGAASVVTPKPAIRGSLQNRPTISHDPGHDSFTFS